MSKTSLLLFNVGGFQTIWWLGVLYHNQFVAISLSIIAIHFLLSSQKLKDAKLMAIVAITGMVIDSLLTLSGVFIFNVTPYWLGLLWMMFALSLPYSLAFLTRIPVGYQALAGGVSGAMSYLAGAKLLAVDLGYGFVTSTILLVVIWSLLLPVLVFITIHLMPHLRGHHAKMAFEQGNS
ncbi:DUF2878 domain-containing protein [Shewanella intestini]|uniref:DUF2878 family protein n=1 Tax=Shewanella intestini TaxID=2017544 RepID=A0ABS5HXU2_9GAMM|nr:MULTISPECIES: DUF2878 domain-containing protein [Shewanella]MBR9726585.1 DUF2878 family protein [Shewanella intestini]MRG34849.1 DUF2878 family protein [Shewanella sp. XMDDZSB0408]